jgi:hypothetical protein
MRLKPLLVLRVVAASGLSRQASSTRIAALGFAPRICWSTSLAAKYSPSRMFFLTAVESLEVANQYGFARTF